MAFDLGGLLAALVRGKVDFVVIGGIAVAAHGYIRATEDLDLVPDPDPDNLDRLVNVLVTLDGRLTRNQQRELDPAVRQALYRGRGLSATTRLGDVDVVQRLPGVPPYAELKASAGAVKAFGVTLSVAARDHLIAMKRARGAPIDLADLERLDGGVEPPSSRLR